MVGVGMDGTDTEDNSSTSDRRIFYILSLPGY